METITAKEILQAYRRVSSSRINGYYSVQYVPNSSSTWDDTQYEIHPVEEEPLSLEEQFFQRMGQ